jgi:NAD(P)-dependent dehydrogenase (short-subunit alcohol dehydrogenase family)
MASEDIENIMAINFMGPVYVCREFLPLIRRSKGHLVNVSSNAGLLQLNS